MTLSTTLRRSSLRPAAAVLAAAGLAFTLAACGSADAENAAAEPAGDAAETGGPLDLADVCPSTVVLQQDWQPQAEHGSMYNLVGPDYTIDADAKSVTGSLVVDGTDTGVDVEVRPGGPSVNFQPVPALMYLDTDIMLGAVTTDVAIVSAADQPVVAVASQLTSSPQIIMWDPETHDGATTIEEAAAAGDPLVTSGEVIPALLESQGIITQSQIDTSYEGTPQRFVSDPAILQQGFATAEPYIYENEIAQWGRPVGFQLLSEVGFDVYPQALTAREATITEEADCLAKLVPIMQRSQLDYLEDPTATNELIVELVEAYATGWTYSTEVADFSVQQQLALDIVRDDEASGVFGQLDPDRMAQVVTDFGEILLEAGTIADADIDPTSLYTNEFIDTSISMGE
ncbi:hypothetical protein [Litorihabitans aurantiacus]|uniref:Nitrate ABC transporter substrate-binding protein n=1 Tax=Litorihabitans aurantiacus TaxID=1930061 RepID=A0AA37XBH3_9MICO|nr:hypothetical protein [Litorihabitans aurantiacus]GMA31034.1 nitrate ABC transporter substrate-binding protein [Litorihabitans aurantiacus]